MKKIRSMQRPRLATIIAGLALFIVLGGTATAASKLINGKNIKAGTVTAKQLKNRTITKAKLAPATIKSLKGKTGAKGAQGIQGAEGDQGIPGQNGVVSPVAETEIGPENVLANVDKSIASFNVPSSKYAVSADFNYTSGSNALVNCALKSGATFIALSSFNGETTRNSVALNGLTSAPVTSLSIVCNSTANGTASNIHVVAIPAAS